MSNEIWIALIALVVAPAITVFLKGWFDKGIREEERERQDVLAARAETKAAALESRLVETARTVERNTRAAAAIAEETHGTVVEVRGMVDGALTQSLQAQHDEITARLVTLQELSALKKLTGHGNGPSLDTMTAMAAAKTRLVALGAEIASRLTQSKKADEKAADRKDNAPGSEAPLPVTDAASEHIASVLERSAHVDEKLAEKKQ